MNRTQMLRTDDIRRLLEVKDFNNKAKAQRADSVCSDDSDRSDLSTKSMPQYSSYRTLSGGLFGPFENSPSKRSTKVGFLHLGRRNSKTPEMSNIPQPGSRLKTPAAAKPRGTGEGSSRPSSRSGSRGDDKLPSDTPVRPTMSRESSASKLPVFRREVSMPQLKRESSIPKIRRESSDVRSKAPPKSSTPATPRGKNVPIITQTTPKTVSERKVSERNIAAKGTRSAVSGISQAVMIGDRVTIAGTEKRGIVQFVGETKFAKGIWAGVVLDDKTGKNDGSVAGIRYFSCPALRGVFVKEEKLQKIADVRDPGFTPHGTAADRVSSNQRNSSSLSTDSGVDEGNDLNIGDYVRITSTTGDREGLLRFLGTTEFAKGTWCGVELSEPSGKNDGAVAGTRYFQCESKHGLFAQTSKVKKITPPKKDDVIETQPGAPTPTEDLNTPDNHVPISSPDICQNVTPTDLDSETEIALQAVDAALADCIISPPPPSISPETESDSDDSIKIAAAMANKHQQVLKGHQENALHLQGQVKMLEREKLNLQNELNDNKQKLEDLQFQLEEQLLIGAEKGPSDEELGKVLGLEADVKEKDKEIAALKSKVEKAKSDIEEEVFRLNEKDILIEGKDKEIEKLQELMVVTKDNEHLLNTEISNLKQQIQDFRDLQSSVSDVETKSENLCKEFEDKLLERDRKVLNMQEELQDQQNKILRLQSDLNDRDAAVSNLQYQLSKNREELNEVMESKGCLNKQILELSKELNEKREELQAITSATENLKHANLELIAKLEASDSRNSQLIDDKKKMEEDILKVSKNSGDNAQQLVYLNEQIQSKNGEIANLQDHLSASTAENHKLIQELADFKEKVNKERLVYEKEKNEEQQKLRDSINVLEDHYKKIKIKNEEIQENAQKEKLQLQQSSYEIENLNEAHKEKNNKLTAAESEVEILKKTIEELSKSSSVQKNEIESLTKELTKKTNTLDETTQEISKLKSEFTGISISNKEVLEEVTNLKIERANLEKRLNCMKQEKETMGSEKDGVVNTYNEVLKKVGDLTKEKEMLQKQYKNSQEQNSELSNKCLLLSTELQTYSATAQKYQEEAVNYQKQLTDGSSNIDSIEKDLLVAKTDLQSVNEKYKRLEKEQEELKQQKADLDSKNERLEEAMKQKARREEEMSKESSSLHEKLKQSVEREENLRTKLNSDRQQLQTQVETSITNIKSMEDEITNLRTQIKVLEESNRSLQVTQQNNNKASDAVSSSQYKSLHDEIEKVKIVKDEKEQEVNFLNSIIVELQKKNKELDDKIKILTYGDELEEDTEQKINDTMSPVRPGLRMRLFCDICDVFDLHDTEDCPQQSNDTGGSQHHGERGSERPFCEVCEMFGHTAENCDDEQKASNRKSKKSQKHWLRRHLIAWK